jgi:RIO kinase 1
MARRLGKRKQKSREEFVLKERNKISDVITDDRTLQNLRKMFSRKVVSEVSFLISTGKEADVYVAHSGDAVEKRFVALKVFRIETSSFAKRIDYITGDPRFDKVKNDLYNMAIVWCKKEYSNLRIAHDAGIDVPEPYGFVGNMLAMEFIGDDSGTPAKRLKDTDLDQPQKVLHRILGFMEKLNKVNLVHADLSEYNVLMRSGKPYIIDMGQAVMRGHPKYAEFMERDVINILHYFRKRYAIDMDYEVVLEKLNLNSGQGAYVKA